jgi:anaerobic selenocysteine-containing dehydrogenase
VNIYRTACPLDCWDQCALLVTEESGRVLSIEPDSTQPITGKSICQKGRRHLERLNHPDRLLYPLLKRNGTFERIGWPEALQLMATKISTAIKNHGPLSLLHFYDGGYGGLLKNIEARFFSALGGCTAHRGSLCWGAGLAAQKYDFGAVLSHQHEDLLNANLILIWGRNPAYTSIHLLPFLRRAQEKGARLIVIDPLRTASAALADQYIRVRPGSDGALALGMAHVLIERNMIDQHFVEKRSSGFERFAAMCREYNPEVVAEYTGLSSAEIVNLALAYGESRPAAILIGIGLQRHSNGCNTVRAIDALAALSGNVGVAGGGAGYANFRISPHIDHSFLSGDDLNPQRRFYAKPQLAAALSGLVDPPVEFLYISRANPLVQVGDSNTLRRAMAKVPFIVTAEHFMTDTAQLSDLVLPCSNFLEAEDLYFNSMSHQYLVYGAKVIEPPGECRPEYEYLADLAGLLSADGYPRLSPPQLIARAIKPLTDTYGLTIEELKAKTPYLFPDAHSIPWEDGLFATAGGKFNFYSVEAERDGGDGLPLYRTPRELSDQVLRDQGYIYWLATPHAAGSIHSTHRLPGDKAKPVAYICRQTADRENLVGGEIVTVASKRGAIRVKVAINDNVSPDTVLVYQGWWHSSGAAVNNLTPDRLTDLGDQAAYYDCLCRIEKSPH